MHSRPKVSIENFREFWTLGDPDAWLADTLARLIILICPIEEWPNDIEEMLEELAMGLMDRDPKAMDQLSLALHALSNGTTAPIFENHIRYIVYQLRQEGKMIRPGDEGYRPDWYQLAPQSKTRTKKNDD